MTATVSNGGYAKSVDSLERRAIRKHGGKALPPFLLHAVNRHGRRIRNSKTRCANWDAARDCFMQPIQRGKCLRTVGRIRKPKREPNRRMDRTVAGRVYPHLPENCTVPSARLPFYSDLFRVHGTGYRSSRGTTWAMARYLPRRAMSPVSSRWFRPCSRSAKTCYYGKFVWRCF